MPECEEICHNTFKGGNKYMRSWHDSYCDRLVYAPFCYIATFMTAKMVDEALRQGWECRLVVDVESRAGAGTIRAPTAATAATAATGRPIAATTSTAAALRTLEAGINLEEDLLSFLSFSLGSVGFSLRGDCQRHDENERPERTLPTK